MGDASGSKTQWLNLLKLLQNGGRVEAGGLKEVDFGDGVNKNIPRYFKIYIYIFILFYYLFINSLKVKNDPSIIPYEKLPQNQRDQITKKEYNKQLQANDNDNESNINSIGLLPVVIFCFSKKKCEEIADFMKSQDLLTQSEKGQVRMLFTQVCLLLLLVLTSSLLLLVVVVLVVSL
jgi:hypothetical protein